MMSGTTPAIPELFQKLFACGPAFSEVSMCVIQLPQWDLLLWTSWVMECSRAVQEVPFTRCIEGISGASSWDATFMHPVRQCTLSKNLAEFHTATTMLLMGMWFVPMEAGRPVDQRIFCSTNTFNSIFGRWRNCMHRPGYFTQ